MTEAFSVSTYADLCKVGTGVVATAAYWDTETSGQATSQGGATGKTTAEMQTLATFADWDIATVQNHGSEVWYIADGEDYPGGGHASV